VRCTRSLFAATAGGLLSTTHEHVPSHARTPHTNARAHKHTQEAAAIRQRRREAAATAEAALYACNPDATYWQRHDSLPPPPCMVRQCAPPGAGSSGAGASAAGLCVRV
jgi:hypothetical protein